MNFLGASGLSQSRSDLLTPVGQLIDQATSDSLLAPDWALNLAVCDAINHDNDGTSPTGEQAVRAFRRKLRDSNPKVVQLTLTLLEAAVKNADQPGRDSAFHALVGTSEFLSNVATLTDGKKGWDVKEQALALLQQWGLSFQVKQATLAFYSTYMDLRLQGVQFPRLEASSPIFTPPPQSSSSSSSSPSPSITTTPTPETELSTSATATAAAAVVKNKAAAELAKLEDDLKEVRRDARACIELLPTSRGIAAGDEALAGVVGFLEACKPRLADVIEVGMEGGEVEGGEEGGVTEGVLELALEVHEEVVQALEAEKAHAMLREKGGEEGDRKAGVGVAAAAETGQTDDLLEFDQHPPPAQAQRPIPTHPDLTFTEAGGGEGRDHRAGGGGESGSILSAPHDPFDLFDATSPAPSAASGAHVEPASESLLPTSSLSGLRLGDDVPRAK